MRYLVLIAGLITSVLVNAQVRKHIKDSGNLINLVGSTAYGENSYLVVNLNNCVSGKNGYVNFAFNGSVNYSKVIDKPLGIGKVIHLGDDNFAIGNYSSGDNKFYLYKINSFGNIEWIRTMYSDTATSFNSITLANDSLGNIYAATFDYDSTRIYKFSPIGSSLFHKTFMFSGLYLNGIFPNDIDVINSNRILLSGSRNWNMGFVEFDSSGNILQARISPYYQSGSHNLWCTNVMSQSEFLVCGKTPGDGMFISKYSYNDDSITYYNIIDTSINQYSFYPEVIHNYNDQMIVFGRVFYNSTSKSSVLYLDSAFSPINHVILNASFASTNYTFRNSLFLHSNGDIIIDSIGNIRDCNSFQGALPVVQVVTEDTSGSFYNGIFLNTRTPEIVSVTDSSVVVSNVYECSSSEIYMKMEEDVISKNFVLFPNPVTDIINILFPDSENYSITIFNITGRMIYHTDIKTSILNVSGFTPGMYLLQLTDGINYYTGKFIKE